MNCPIYRFVQEIIFQNKAGYQDDQCCAYEFINVGQVPVQVNDVLLYPILFQFPTTTEPLTISPNLIRWKPDLKDCEIDGSTYKLVFREDLILVPTIPPAAPRLLVIKKYLVQKPKNC